METKQGSKFCARCQRQTLHAKSLHSSNWGCLLTAVTGGLFFPVWVIQDWSNRKSKWRCQICGATYEKGAVIESPGVCPSCGKPTSLAPDVSFHSCRHCGHTWQS